MRPTRVMAGLRIDRFSGIYLWALFIVVFSIWVPATFPTAATLHSVAAEQAIEAMLAIAVLLPLATGAFDLSVGATVNFAAVFVIVMQTTHHWGMWPSIAMTIALSVAIGLTNGFLVVKLKISSFVATLGSAAVIIALQDIVSGQAQPVAPVSSAWTALTQRTVLGFQIVVVYLLVLALLAWWLLSCTPWGRSMHAVGGNAEAARLSGVAVGRWTWTSLVLSATISGIAGVAYASLSGPSLDFGPGLLLPAFAAAFLGSTQLQPGRYNVWGTVIAVYVLATGVKGLQLITSVQWLSDMFNGVALIAAVGFAGWRHRRAGVRRPGAPREPDAHRTLTPQPDEPEGATAKST